MGKKRNKSKKHPVIDTDLNKNSVKNTVLVGPPKKIEPIPKEELVGASKQLISETPEKKKTDVKLDKIIKDLKEIHYDNTKLEKANINLSSSLLNDLDPPRLILDNAKSRVTPNGSIFNVAGKTSKRQNFNDLIYTSIENRMRDIITTMPSGLYGKILQAKYNNYLEENLPILKQSATIFIDDVCNGSYRGSETDNVKRFRFYQEGGVEITDEKRVTRMGNILNPKNYERISSSVVSFNDVDWQSEYDSWKDGYSLVRVVPNKKIAMNLYIKYVLKTAKAKKDKTEAVHDMNNRGQTAPGTYDVDSNTNELPIANNDTNIRSIGREADSYGYEEFNNLMINGEVFMPYRSTFDINEFLRHREESLESFLDRNVTNDANPIYCCSKILLPTSRAMEKGSYFTYEIDGYSNEALRTVTDMMKRMLYNKTDFSIESDIDDMITYDVANVTYEDILNNTWDRKSYYDAPDRTISLEASGIDVLNGLSNLSSTIDSNTGANPTIEEKVANKNINYSRISKMFSTITGESIEYLDNTRTIPILVGNRLVGAFYIEFTHQDVEHYMGLRQLMNSNMVGSSDSTAFGIKQEEQEETIGRMIFGDIIKPMFEKNVDTKFLKNNSDILMALQKLLKENEVSNTIGANTFDRQNGFNLSRIIFIPEEELIFKRNGKLNLGESRFNLAMVPANAAILGNESYLAYLLIDSKGMSFIEIPPGLSEVQGEEGTNPLMDQFNDMRITRSRLRDLTLNNYDLGHKLIYVQKPDNAPGIDIRTIQIPQPELDDQRIQNWVQQATDIVGYNSALFNTIDGNVEFARNLFEMNEIKLLQILTCRANKVRPSSELATKLLRLRDPSYENITVEWVAPPINRSNTQKRSEQAKEILDLFDIYVGVMENLYADNEDYALVAEEAKKLLLERIGGDDQIIIDIIHNIVKEAIEKKNVILASDLDEEDEEKSSKKKSKDEEENNENEENTEE